MSYALVVAETRRNIFEERNMDSIGLCSLMGKDAFLLIPSGDYNVNEQYLNGIIKVKVEESMFLNPIVMVNILEKIMASHGKPDLMVFTNSASGTELASYAAGYFNVPIITDVSAYDKERGTFSKSYYSDKIFGEFKPSGEGTFIITVRSGSFKENLCDRNANPSLEIVEDVETNTTRTFMEFVEEEKSGIDITKAEFLLSIGRGTGNNEEVAEYEELAKLLKAVISGSRPVIDKLWLPKTHQVGTSGKTVKPKVYLAMGISGAFQHIAGMKDSDCIIAVNKDPEAPIFQYAHYGIIGDMHKVRDKLKEMLKEG
ncbi:MAG: Electron transfer flavoprotein subunit alpha [Syntrophorhabdaceae bacterium]|nr:Electron transfer flavoprotein subunit alpha [Syntrophorhabdaceae bacterium]HNQ63661.1 electron transfer flavoprotein subunit alpha/FixB family protein [Syntrophorhabdaceae bacterium]HNZ59353.1 electron transfer flavoprotein subunit alpha/FixB family protein [Syntrophorhabdaceae bacterium]HOG40426.1 electron transfer flavoprotein subunit alpha/FixB family protein [Syntrophorhabdaceae bacterium]